MSELSMWRFTNEWGDSDLAGLEVEATDGHIGSVEEASMLGDNDYLVVDTGPWIFGKKVMLPAGLVTGVDLVENKVLVGCTREQVKNSPEFDQEGYREAPYRDRLSGYYGSYFR